MKLTPRGALTATALPTWDWHRGGSPGLVTSRDWVISAVVGSTAWKWKQRGITATASCPHLIISVPQVEGEPCFQNTLLLNSLFLKLPAHNLSVDCTVWKISIKMMISSSHRDLLTFPQHLPTPRLCLTMAHEACSLPLPFLLSFQVLHFFQTSAQMPSSPGSRSSQLLPCSSILEQFTSYQSYLCASLNRC